MSNPFNNNGFATILPKQTAGVYRTLAYGQQQLQQDKQFQEELELKRYKANLDFAERVITNGFKTKGMFQAGIRELGYGYTNQALTDLSENGRLTDASFQYRKTAETGLNQSTTIEGIYGEKMKFINENGRFYNEGGFKDFLTKYVHETDKNGNTRFGFHNTNFKVDELENGLNQFADTGEMAYALFEDADPSIATRVFKEDELDQIGEQDIEYYNDFFTGDFNDNGDLIPKEASPELLAKFKRRLLSQLSPELFEKFKNDYSETGDLKEAYMNWRDERYQPIRKATQFKNIPKHNSASSTPISFDPSDEVIDIPIDKQISNRTSQIKGKRWDMPDLIRGMNIEYDGQTIEGEFQGIVPTAEGYAFKFSRREDPTMEELANDPTASEKRTRSYLIPITDTTTAKAIKNALKGGEQIAFMKAFKAAQGSEIETWPLSQEAVDSYSASIYEALSSGNYDSLRDELEKAGLVEGKDYKIKEKSWWQPSDQRGIEIDGKIYKASDKEALNNAIKEKLLLQW